MQQTYGMNTFDFITVHVVFFIMIYYVYKEAQFRDDIDYVTKKYFNLFCEKSRRFFETVAGLNAFLLLDYEEYDRQMGCEDQYVNVVTQHESKGQDKKVEKNEEKYEDKYLERFKKFPNEYFFSQEEEVLMRNTVETKRINAENALRANMERLLQKIDHIDFINKKGVETEEGIKDLLSYYNLDYEEYKLDPEYLENCDEDFTKLEQIYDKFLNEKRVYEIQLEELKAQSIDMEQIKKDAKDSVIKSKLDNLKNSYVMDFTPLGNVVMRYDNNRGTFEYFSNNTIPYRYLEPVGRKYVMTYFCKPLFVDLEEELKRAEEKYDQEKEKEKEKEKEMKINEPKQVFANLKSYNKPLLKSTPLNMPTKNRDNGNFVLPPQIKANLPNVNSNTNADKHLLKDNANRYTWEGRFSNWVIIKKIDRKQIDKKYAMTFADFKKMQSK